MIPPHKTFEYKIGADTIKVMVTVVGNSVTITDDNGCSFFVSWLPLHLWREINAFVEGVVGGTIT